MLDLLISESPSKSNIKDSISGFVHRVQRYSYRIGIKKFEYDEDKIAETHEIALSLLCNYINPSCFKAAAALTIGVCATRPFQADLPKEFTALASFPNAVFSVLESVYWIDGAELLVKPDDVRKLSEPIEFSDHFFREFVETCGRIGSNIDGSEIKQRNVSEAHKASLRILALTYEALAYQRNGHCKYPPPSSLKIDKYFNLLD